MTDVADFRKLRTLCVGGAVIDVIVQIDSDRIEEMTMRNAEVSFLLVETGRKVTAKSISEHIGGGAVNTAVAAVLAVLVRHAVRPTGKAADDTKPADDARPAPASR